jgi:hypothetical protein
MRVFRNDAQDGEPLSSDLHAVLAEEFYRGVAHPMSKAASLDNINYWDR